MQHQLEFFICKGCGGTIAADAMGMYEYVCMPCCDEESDLQRAIAELYGEETGATLYHLALSQDDET
jgi:hypothetical protein